MGFAQITWSYEVGGGGGILNAGIIYLIYVRLAIDLSITERVSSLVKHQNYDNVII